MRQHDELDRLSALMDGEIGASERVELEAHIATCDDCRIALEALRSTLADLRSLPEPAPTEQDSWALRSAIRRARSPQRRWQRVAWASGAAAASVIAIVALVAGLRGDGGSTDLAAGGREAAERTVALQSSALDYDPATAHARLLSIAGIATDAPLAARPAPASTPNPAESAPQRSSAGVTGGGGYTTDSAAGPEAASAELTRCVDTVRASSQEQLVAVHYEAATFESKPVFLLIFHTQDRYELWIVARPGCDVVYFAQAG